MSAVLSFDAPATGFALDHSFVQADVRLDWSLRWRRVAAYVGNTATELAKEAPYYVGAGGFALFTDSVSAIDAIVFLAGANTGAAIYGFALARGLGYFLARLAKRGVHASFDTEWEPSAYLQEYYSEIEPEERETIAFFVDAMKDADRTQPALSLIHISEPRDKF